MRVNRGRYSGLLLFILTQEDHHDAGDENRLSPPVNRNVNTPSLSQYKSILKGHFIKENLNKYPA